MSASDARNLWGDNLSCEYVWSGVEYTATLQYAGICTMYGANIASNDVLTSSTLNSYDVIMYKGHSVAGRYGWIRDVSIICPVYSDGYLRGGFMARVGANSLDPIFDNNLISDAPDNQFAGFSALSCNTDASASLSDYYNVIYSTIPDGGRHTFRSITYLAQTGINSDRVYFDNIQVDYYGDIYFCIICPYYSGDISITAPVETTTTITTSGTDINVNVDVDLTETNGILGSIRDLISNLGSFIVNGIKGLFLPDADDITNWKQTIVTILNETFGGIPELENQLKDAISSIFSATARQTVTFKGIKVPAVADQPEAIIVPEQEVALRPPGFDNLFSWAETFINIVATIAVANTCFNQIKRIVVGEVVIDAD